MTCSTFNPHFLQTWARVNYQKIEKANAKIVQHVGVHSFDQLHYEIRVYFSADLLMAIGKDDRKFGHSSGVMAAERDFISRDDKII